jgi:hypothetical protein
MLDWSSTIRSTRENDVMCNCMKHLGYKRPPSSCSFYPDCRAELAPRKTAKSLDDEALFKTFVSEFPVLSALDLFCNKCGHPMALGYGRTTVPPNIDAFYAEFFCHGVTCRAYLTVAHAAAGEKIDKETALCNAGLVRNSEPYQSEGP